VEQKDCLDEASLKKKLIFDEIHKDTDAGFESNRERSQKDLQYETEFTYGEVIYTTFVPVLEYVKPKAGEVFWDLGCGGGKPLLIASLNWPQLAICKGVEFLEYLVDLATTVSCELTAKCEEAGLTNAPISITKGDMLKTDWFDADILYLSSVCFPDELLEGIVN